MAKRNNIFLFKETSFLRAVVYVLILFLFCLRLYFVTVFQWFEFPLISVATWISNETQKALAPLTTSEKDLKQVIQQRNDLAVDRAEFEQFKRENESLTKEIGLQNRVSYKTVAASIIRRSVSTQTSTFMIDVGEEQGVVKDAAVLVDDGLFVGKIARVEKKQSLVTASTDFNLSTAVTLLNKTQTIGIAKGAAGNLVRLEFIPIDEEISVNQLVITSGLDPFVPSGFIVGIVNSVAQDPEAPFQIATVEPLTDIRRHDHVVVVVP